MKYEGYTFDDDDSDSSSACCLRKILCWPPWPKRSIPKGLITPPSSSYNLCADSENTQHFIFFSKPLTVFYEMYRSKLDSFFATTSRGSAIACMMFRPVKNALYTIFYSHGSTSDLGTELTFCLRLGILLDCNVFSYDYSGYGASSGKPSLSNILADVDCAWYALRMRYGVLEERIILFGRALGTVPTIEVGSGKDPTAVVLQSPQTSMDNVVFREVNKPWCSCERFPSLEKLPEISCPILVVHGTNDQIVNVSHGVSIFERYSEKVEPLWIQGAGHNDIQFNMQYLERLRKLTTQQFPNTPSKETLESKIRQLRTMNLYL